MTARHVLPPGAKADEEQLLKIVADQVAIAAENARLFEGVMRRAAEQESLVESGRLLTGTLQVSEVLSRLSELVRSRFRRRRRRILISAKIRPASSVSTRRPGDRTARETVQHDVGDDDGLIGWIAKHRRPLAYSDVLTEPRVKRRQWLESEGVVSVLGLPLFLESELVGVLNILYRTRHVFTPEELPSARRSATSASVAIRNARLHEQTEERLRHTETAPGREPGRQLDAGAHRDLEADDAGHGPGARRRHGRSVASERGREPLRADRGLPRVPKELLGTLETANIKSLDPR